MGTKPQRKKKKVSQNDLQQAKRVDSEMDGVPSAQDIVVTNNFASLTAEDKADLIAEISESVLEDPSKAFFSGKEKDSTGGEAEGEDRIRRTPSKMQNLLDLGRVHKNGGDEYIACLAIMSALALFKDILPTYRIRMPTDAEREATLSKETKQLWDYERALLTNYQQYLQLLEKTWDKGQQKSSPPSRSAITAMLSLCELLKAAFYFNFRSNIIVIVVRNMNNRKCQQVSDACCQAVEHVFQNDAQGEVAMEVSRMVSKLIKGYRGYLRPAVLRTFVKLPLRVHVDEAQAAKLAAAANAKKRKRDREAAEIESELKEGSSSVDKIVLARCQSETLQSVILSYFRILKSPDTEAKKELLPAALEGLAKFAHLINIDTVIDLLELLKQILSDVDSFPLEASLNCVLTAFQTLHGPGKEMQIDPKEYITPLYSQLSRLGTEQNSRSNTSIMLKCLNAAFLKRREYSAVRVAAFLKQIFTVASHAPSYTSVPLLAFSRQLLQQYPGAHQLLENEQDVITSGQYTPDVADPEHSNPFSTSAWELSNLMHHIDPSVSEQAQATATLKMLQMPGEAPERLLAQMTKEADELYIKFRRSTKKHPLLGKTSDRRQIRFPTPRTTTSSFY